MIRPRLRFPLVCALLTLFAVPAVIEQARDVDVLLYMAAAARADAAGALPYTAAWIEKGPLAMGLFQGVAAVFGPGSFPGLAIVWLALALAGAWLARELARQAGAGWSSGWAALLFAVSIGAVGGTLNTEVPAMVLIAAACLLWLRGSPFTAGALVGAGFLCRQNVGIVWPAIVLLEAAYALGGRRRIAEAMRAGALVTAGLALPVAATAVLYAATGGWEAFRFCFWDYNAEIYLAATSVSAGRLARIPWDAAVSFAWPIRTTAALALVGAAAAFRKNRAAAAMAVVAAALCAAMVPGLRFFSHYAAVVVPFAAALGALGLEAVLARAGRRGTLALALVACSLGIELADRGWLDAGSRLRSWLDRGGWRRLADPLEWPGNDEAVLPVARFVRERSGPGDRVFVWGMRPHVPVYAARLHATRFTTCTFLTGLVPWERMAPYHDTTRWIVPGAWDLLARDLEAERPRFIVDASQDHLFGEGAYAPSKFPVLQAILDRDYERVFTSEGRDRFVVWQRLSGRTPGSAGAGASRR